MKKLLILTLAALLLLTGCNITFRNNVETKEGKSSSTTVELSVDKALIESKGVDSVIIKSTLINDLDFPVATAEKTYSSDDFTGKTELPYDFKAFGKHEVTLIYQKNGKTIEKALFDYILTADEYNIALLRATLPVTYFSMLMTKEDSSIKFDNTLPTIIALERATSYNWEKLYENMYPNPFSDIEKLKSNNSTDNNRFYSQFVSEMQTYVKYLHNLNPESKFHIVLNDFSVDMMFKLTYENGLDENLFSVLFLSDGSGSYSYFRSVYGAEEDSSDPSLTIYTRYEEALKSAKAKASKGDTTYIKDVQALNSSSDIAFFGLLPAVINDSSINVQWVVNRKNTDTFGSSDAFVEKTATSSSLLAFNLSSHSSKFTEEEKSRLKDLFNFNITDFEAAEKAGKKIMIFLGTRLAYEKYLEDELILMKTLFGEEYACFYKGHPGDSYNEERDKILSRQGITALDASIPAELFLLFKPEVEMCGISSTTFESYTHDEIPFIEGYNASWAYKDKVNLYLEATGNEDNPYKLTKLKSNEYSYWNPKNPTVFDWKPIT